MNRQEQMMRNFSSEKGVALQEYLVYFKKPQRISGLKFPSDAAGGFVQRSLKN